MKRLLPIFIAMGIISSDLQAQVTLNSSMAPLPGSMLHFEAFDNPSTFVFDREGENLNWDFTGQPSHATDAIIYADPATTPYPTAYPTANLAVNMDDGTGYIENGTTQELLLGVVGDPGNGVQVMPFFPPMPLFDFPYTYGSTMNTSSQIRVRLDGASFGIPGTDSVKYHMTLSTTRKVQGWGTLHLPNGTYDGSLLEKSETIQVDSVWMKVIFLGWILAPGYPETIYDSSYRWLTDELLHPFAEVNFDETGAIDGVTYYKGLNVSNNSTAIENEATVHPNPVSDVANIVFSEQTSVTQIELYSTDGRIAQSHEVEPGKCAYLIDCRTLKAGIYFAVLHTSKGERVVKRIVKK